MTGTGRLYRKMLRPRDLQANVPDFSGQHLGSDGLIGQGLHAVAHRGVLVELLQLSGHGHDELVLSDLARKKWNLLVTIMLLHFKKDF